MLFDPEVLGRLEIVSKDRDNLLDLLVTVRVHKEVDRGLILLSIAISNVQFELKLALARQVFGKASVFKIRVESMHLVA